MIPAPSKQVRKRSVRILMIFDKQNPHGLMFRQFGRNRWRNLSRSSFTGRKNQRKSGAFVSTGALRSDCSFVRFHKCFADGEAKLHPSTQSPAALFESHASFWTVH